MRVVKIGTRKSPLAMWQAKWVKSKIEQNGLMCELVPIETIGDKKLNTSIAKIGSKGVFTQELEEMLIDGSIDIAVHSAKDLASDLGNEFRIIAFGPREEVEDVLISDHEVDVTEKLHIGTASTRRVAQVRMNYGYWKTSPVRGNLQTRIAKLREGQFDALLLAKAGVIRMGYEDLLRFEFPLDKLTPAAGQGSVAVESHEKLDEHLRDQIRIAVNDPRSEKCILAERHFLRTMQGGCSIPIYAYAKTLGKKSLELTAGILSLDGKVDVRHIDSHEDPATLGQAVGEKILGMGGKGILVQIKSQLGYL